MKTTIGVDGITYLVDVGFAGYLAGNALSDDGRSYVLSLIGSRAEACSFAAKTLVGTWNEVWREPDEPAMTRDVFARRLALHSITILDEPDSADLFFSDDGLFAGHWIIVSFEGTSPTSAEIAG